MDSTTASTSAAKYIREMGVDTSHVSGGSIFIIAPARGGDKDAMCSNFAMSTTSSMDDMTVGTSSYATLLDGASPALPSMSSTSTITAAEE